MDAIIETIMEEETPWARVSLLLKHFSELGDEREPWRVMYPLKEVLLLVTCATIASCDDFDDIVAWGKHHLAFLRRFSEFHHGIPCERWLRALVNRIDPVLFGRCFNSWIAALWPDRHEFIAIDGKTSRRTHDERKGLKALHTLSAYATNARLTLAQLGVPEKTNEITAIPEILDELAEHKQLKGAMVTIDELGCQVSPRSRRWCRPGRRLSAAAPGRATPSPHARRGCTSLRRRRTGRSRRRLHGRPYREGFRGEFGHRSSAHPVTPPRP